MKKYKAVIFVLALFAGFTANAQNPDGENLPVRDSIVYRQVPVADTTLIGKSIFDVLPSRAKGYAADVTIHQTEAVTAATEEYISRNHDKQIQGYRVRIFFDNRQNARSASAAALDNFLSVYHGIPAYRTYQNPFFKVTVGDFRTKSEAMELLRMIKGNFPAAFVVKEPINFPVIDKKHSFEADTIKVSAAVL